MVIKFYPLTHIEISVNDAVKAYELLHNTLGAEKVQEELAEFLGGENALDIHVGLGDVVLQFVQPKTYIGSWSDQLEKSGPGVHNLTFEVEDMESVKRELEKEGIKPIIEMPFDWGQLIDKELLKPKTQPVIIFDSMEKLGFNLELYESPLKQRIEAQTTKYVTGHDELIGDVSPMLHIELVTGDIEATCDLLKRLFGSEKVEIKFAEFLDSPFMKVIHINLSNVVLQYCQPLMEQGSWHEQLKDRGTSVHNITFVVPDLLKTAEKFEKEGVTPLFTFPLDWSQVLENVKPNVPPIYMMNTMEHLGFHLEMGEPPTDDGVGDLLFIDYE
jgi:catechol 2,3-dioxygenase-like lactoylglutathione lyase family enzyme